MYHFLAHRWFDVYVQGAVFSVSHGGQSDVTKHVGIKRHIEMSKASSWSRFMSSFFQFAATDRMIEAETRWVLFVAKHNLAFLNSDHSLTRFSGILKQLKSFHVLVQSVQLF